MKKPKLNELVENKNETNRIRKWVKKGGTIKVSYLLDQSLLKKLKYLALHSSKKYQKLQYELMAKMLHLELKKADKFCKPERELMAMKERFKRLV